jgi:hypothetical protein
MAYHFYHNEASIISYMYFSFALLACICKAMYPYACDPTGEGPSFYF